MIIVPEMIDSLKSKLLESILGSLVKPKEPLKYDIVILSILPNLEASERFKTGVYEVKGALIGAEEGELIDYDSLAYVRKTRIDEVLEFRALVNKELDIVGIELVR
jgi:hypothetical protein